MKIIYYLFICIIICSCGKIDLPQSKPSKEKLQTDSLMFDTLSFSDLQKLKEPTYAYIKGYMVGYINGTSFKQAKLQIPTTGSNTNFILAENLSDTIIENMIAVKLEKKDGIRDKLNLYTHPNFFHQQFEILGLISSYFQKMGIVKILECNILYPKHSKKDTINTPIIDATPHIIIGK